MKSNLNSLKPAPINSRRIYDIIRDCPGHTIEELCSITGLDGSTVQCIVDETEGTEFLLMEDEDERIFTAEPGEARSD
jgi:hypothetical protein